MRVHSRLFFWTFFSIPPPPIDKFLSMLSVWKCKTKMFENQKHRNANLTYLIYINSVIILWVHSILLTINYSHESQLLVRKRFQSHFVLQTHVLFLFFSYSYYNDYNINMGGCPLSSLLMKTARR